MSEPYDVPYQPLAAVAPELGLEGVREAFARNSTQHMCIPAHLVADERAPMAKSASPQLSLTAFVRAPAASLDDVRAGARIPLSHRNQPMAVLERPTRAIAVPEGREVPVAQLQRSLAELSAGLRAGRRYAVTQHGRRVADLVPVNEDHVAVAAAVGKTLIGLAEFDDAASFIGQGNAGIPLTKVPGTERSLMDCFQTDADGDAVHYWDQAGRCWGLSTLDVRRLPELLALDVANERAARLCDLRIAQRGAQLRLPDFAQRISGAYLRSLEGHWSLLVVIGDGAGVASLPVRATEGDGLGAIPCDSEHVPQARAAIVRDLFCAGQGGGLHADRP